MLLVIFFMWQLTLAVLKRDHYMGVFMSWETKYSQK